MLFLKCLLGSVLIFACIPGNAQDTINKTDGEKIIGKVLEVDNSSVRYKKSSNPDGPDYILEISEISSIRYQNNETEVFARSEQPKQLNLAGLNKDEILKEITQKGNKVFIESKDENAILHATNGIQGWGYWKVTKNKTEADFILRFDYIHAGLGDAFGKALFINPQNNEVLRQTKEVNTVMSWDMNTKRGVINKLIAKEIRPYYTK
jgi:hypothetical protein